jgi:hypothetical protein
MDFERVIRLLPVVLLCCATQACTETATSPTPLPPPVVTLTSVVVSGSSGTATAGEQFTLKAMANYSDTTTQDVTTQATWQSSDRSVADVDAAGAVRAVAAGATDIRATYNNVSGSLHLAVVARPLPGLAGRVTDATNSQPINRVEVLVLDGPNAGRLTLTDDAGAYSLTNLAIETFTVRFVKEGYITATRTIALLADTRIDLALSPSPPAINVSGFYGTYSVGLSVTSQSCGEFPVFIDPTGTLVLSGRTDGSGLSATMTERGVSRTYEGGRMDANGRFGGFFSGLVPGFAPTDRITPRHDASGSISGTVSGRTVGGTEDLTYGAPCPGGSLRVSFSGGR